MLQETYPYYLANKPQKPNTDLDVIDKFTGEVATRVALADAATIDQAIAASVKAAEPCHEMAAYERQKVLNHCVKRFQDRFDDLAHHESLRVVDECRKWCCCREWTKPSGATSPTGKRVSPAQGYRTVAINERRSQPRNRWPQ